MIRKLLLIGVAGLFTCVSCSAGFLAKLKDELKTEMKANNQNTTQPGASDQPQPPKPTPTARPTPTPTPTASVPAQTELEIKTLSQSQQSQLREPQQRVVRDQAAFQQLWSAHAGSTENMPSVDFSQEMVLAAFMGEKPTGGFSIRIAKASLTHNQLLVTVEEKQPPPDALVIQVLTAPAHIVSVKKTDAEVKFQTQQK